MYISNLKKNALALILCFCLVTIFSVDINAEALSKIELLSPVNLDTPVEEVITLRWSLSSDPRIVNYSVYLADENVNKDELTAERYLLKDLTFEDNKFTLSGKLRNGSYWWIVQALDNEGVVVGESEIYRFNVFREELPVSDPVLVPIADDNESLVDNAYSSLFRLLPAVALVFGIFLIFLGLGFIVRTRIRSE